jgi:hypothetical protein
LIYQAAENGSLDVDREASDHHVRNQAKDGIIGTYLLETKGKNWTGEVLKILRQ